MGMFQFNVSLFGNMTFEVVAPNHEEAERILKDTMDSIDIKSLMTKKTSRDDVSIKKSEVVYKSSDVKDKERGR